MSRILKLTIVAFSLLALIGCSQEEKGEFYLPKTVTIYISDMDGSEYREFRRFEYEYENGYPIKCTLYENGGESSIVTEMRYQFDGELPLKREDINEAGQVERTVEYNRGRVYLMTSDSEFAKYQSIFQYNLDDDYFTSVLHVRNSKEEEYAFTMEEIDSIQVYEENGLLAKTVNSGLYANWNDGEEKEWMRFNGTYGLEYENGIVIRNHDAYRAGGDPIDFHFELNKENGLLMEAVKMMHYKGDEQATPDRRIVFEYSDIKTDEARYTRMVNAHLIDGDNNYYIFNWY